MKTTLQSAQPLTDLRLGSTIEPLHQLVWQWQRGHVDPNTAYQRPDVWTREQQILFIGSAINGLPLPAIIVNRRPRKGVTRYVIDGKQRLTAARAWFEGKLAVPASWFEPKDVVTTEDTADGPYVRYTGLTDEMQNVLEAQVRITVSEGRLPDEKAEADVYLRVNGLGTPQTDADIARARKVAER